MSYDQKKFGERLLEARKLKKLTQEEVGSALKVSHQTVYTWEKGTSGISFPMVVALAKLLDASIDWLVGMTEQNTGFGQVSESERDIIEAVLRFLREKKVAEGGGLQIQLDPPSPPIPPAARLPAPESPALARKREMQSRSKPKSK